ncbi:AAEL009123-PA [Aedes aegypti]|uniref:AAEL009123-PA n=2 Tax=Aedes aegypti TaxID=7159 RepID=A0A1S4FLD0_AEDAE|nr:cytochrome P450 6d3 [Aedes aegypti]EAT39045.1 AAEL009123-PA [Aedes aegypti]
MFIYTFALFWLALVLVLRYIYSYWDRNGLASIKPQIPYGNLKSVAQKTQSFGVATCELYWKSQERLAGIYLFFRPAVLIRDAHLAQRIMTTDFSYFHDRGVYCNEEIDPFSANLFALPGKRWRNLRHRFTPLFTSGQLRCMMPTILDVGHKLQKFLEPAAERQEVVDIREIVSRGVLELIASLFFGFEADCINDPDDAFSKTLREFQLGGFMNNFRTACTFVCPELLQVTRISSLSPQMIKFATDVVTKQIEHREKNNVSRKDFIQLLIDLRREEANNNEVALSFEQCAANVFLFYVAGSDTSTSAITFTLHELTQNPEVMDKLQSEIDEMLVQTNGELTYTAIKELPYLDLCVKETLRKYPGLAILNRKCTKSYAVPESSVVIQEGTQIMIPLLAYGMDEKYFPEPERYYPERFNKQSKNYDEKAYYPFGEGPRNCIAYRMGVMVSKIGLILLLSKFKFEATQGPKIVFSAATVPLVPKGGIPVKISNR